MLISFFLHYILCLLFSSPNFTLSFLNFYFEFDIRLISDIIFHTCFSDNGNLVQCIYCCNYDQWAFKSQIQGENYISYFECERGDYNKSWTTCIWCPCCVSMKRSCRVRVWRTEFYFSFQKISASTDTRKTQSTILKTVLNEKNLSASEGTFEFLSEVFRFKT